MTLSSLFLYMLAGALAGTLAGLMGLGGGLLYVPLLVWNLEQLGVESARVPFMAVSTSLAVIVLSLPNSLAGHWKNGNILPRLIPPLLLGGVAGAALASLWLAGVEARPFKLYLGVFQWLVAWRMLATLKESPPSRPMAGFTSLMMIGFVSGASSAFFGVGGGVIAVALMHFAARVPLKASVATSSVYMMGATTAALGSYLLQSQTMGGFPPHSWGGVYLPALIALWPTAFLFNRLGAQLAHRVPVSQLKQAIAGLLVVVGAWGIWHGIQV
ncbi:MAG: sulfite exporter TauE/SafE family protein [Deltaproteobacteria bacterium]|nr:sulfite exporter TauE/SafE family protein [Deltaproteobacteria bacterium]